MDYKAHAAIALLCASGAFYLFLGISDPVRLLCLGAFAMVAGLLPDIDTGESRGRAALDAAVIAGAMLFSYTYSCGSEYCVLGLDSFVRMVFLALALLGVYFLFTKFVMPRHRGVVHSLLACLVFTALLYALLGRLFALAGFIGYFSHLAADNEMKLR